MDYIPTFKIRDMNPEIYVQIVCLLLVSAFLIRALLDKESR